jgi:hypothetical protein
MNGNDAIRRGEHTTVEEWQEVYTALDNLLSCLELDEGEKGPTVQQVAEVKRLFWRVACRAGWEDHIR